MFKTQTRKEVEFQSSLLISNTSPFDVLITSRTDEVANHFVNVQSQAKKKNLEEFDTFEELIIARNLVKESSIVRIEPGQVFHVPLSWFVKERSIYIMKKSGNFHLLFPNIREHFMPSNLDENYSKRLKPLNIELLDDQSQASRYVSVNIALFKCKPTTLNLPGQYLVTLTPPICVSNYLFNEI